MKLGLRPEELNSEAIKKEKRSSFVQMLIEQPHERPAGLLGSIPL